MLRHFQRGMSQQPLKSKSISTTVYQILSGESVSEKVGTCFLDTSRAIIPGNGVSECVSPQLIPILCAKQEIAWVSTTSGEVLPQNGNQYRTQGDSLHLSIFGMAKNDLAIFQINILDLNAANGSSTTTIVQQKIDNHPGSILIKVQSLSGFFKRSISSASV